MKVSKVCWVDTGFFVQNWHRMHKKYRSEGFWTYIDKQIDEGVLRMPRRAYIELMEKDDDLAKWVRIRRDRGLCIPVNAHHDVEDHYREIVAHVQMLPKPQRQKDKAMRGADLWIIAYAKAEPNRNGVCVTQEDPAKKHDGRVKVPDVCKGMGVTWRDTYGMLDLLDPDSEMRL